MSAIEVDTDVIGDAEIAMMFKNVNSSVRERLRVTLVSLGTQLRDRAKAAAPFKHGKLQGSIRAKLIESDGAMTERVGPPVFYGRFLEHGVGPKEINVTRRVRGRDVRAAVGYRVKVRADGSSAPTARLVARRKIVSRGATTYRRRIYIRAKPFMQPAMDAMEKIIPAALQAAVAEGAQ